MEDKSLEIPDLIATQIRLVDQVQQSLLSVDFRLLPTYNAILYQRLEQLARLISLDRHDRPELQQCEPHHRY